MSKFKPWLPHVLGALLLVSLGTAGYMYNQLKALKQSPDAATKQELQEVMAKVSHLIRLPEGEEPILATVSDPEKLKDQPFFAKAQAGDKVLVYIKAQKAYLYNPGANILIDVGATTVGQADTSAPKTTSPATGSSVKK